MPPGWPASGGGWARPAPVKAGTCSSNIGGRETKLIDCRRWRLIWSNFEWPQSSRPGWWVLWRLRLQLPASQLCSTSALTPCSSALLRLNRPGGNLTGFNNVASELGAKGLALLHELVPGTETIGFLENPNNPTSELTTRDMLAAAPAVGLKVQILKASNDREIDAAFVSLAQARTGALIVANDLFFNNRIERLIELAAHYAIPTMYTFREFVVAGGVFNFRTKHAERYPQIGPYSGRLLKREETPALPGAQNKQ